MKRILLCIACFLSVILCAMAQNVVRVDVPGTLCRAVTKELIDTCSHLVVNGKLNSEDIHFLRHLCGCEADCHKGIVGKLQVLDIRNAKWERDKHPYMTLRGTDDGLYGWVRPDWLVGFQDQIVIQHPGLNGSSTQNWGGAPFYRPQIVIVGKRRVEFVQTYLDSRKGELLNLSQYVSKDEWKRVKNRWLPKVAAHRLIREDSGTCVLYAYLMKKKVTYDMFYKCPTVKAVILPKGTEFLEDVYVYDLSVKYYVAK